MIEQEVTRREFVAAVGSTVAALALPAIASSQGASTGFTGEMDERVYRPVRLVAVGARPSMDTDAQNSVERRLRCMCGCTLDVYTCRTTDFTCQVSPAMHRDVSALVAGGHDGASILRAFTDVYGERVLMAPRKEGFNWAAYIMPFAALGAGAAAVVAFIRKWRTPASVEAQRDVPIVAATPEELARLEDAVRRDAP
ncbi:MAG TPA: cytochrome c-type biogenesis protein CcmH [Gemmatimonadaceae bacterium]|nr:cytochrome c-type biogenesis protein CcmH [Gemmatimonadaceae bacterium]